MITLSVIGAVLIGAVGFAAGFVIGILTGQHIVARRTAQAGREYRTIIARMRDKERAMEALQVHVSRLQ